jgi:hypothetical protein
VSGWAARSSSVAVAADLFARAERVLGYDLHALVATAPKRNCARRVQQPAIFVVNYALAAAAGDLPVARARATRSPSSAA